MTIPTTAAARTRMVRTALTDGRYSARVTSAPVSHQAQISTVDQCPSITDVAAYLREYLRGLAEVAVCGDDEFISIGWSV
jgi:hypothetical protein